jgi:hypothetical protein
MIIDCGSCAVAGPACDDCVVSVLLGMPEVRLGDIGDMTDIDAFSVRDVDDEHAAALTVLADSGLVPPLRLVPRAQPDPSRSRAS